MTTLDQCTQHGECFGGQCIHGAAGGDETPVAWMLVDANGKLMHYSDGPVLSVEPRSGYQSDYDAGCRDVPLFTRPTPAAAAGVPTGWKIEPTQLDDELSIVPPFDAARGVQPRGICVAAWSTCDDSRILYALARALLAASPVALWNWKPSYSESYPNQQRLKRLRIHHPDGSSQELVDEPVAPAGVPSDEQIDALWLEHTAYTDEEGFGPIRAFARAVLSAGAPAVPMQDSRDSSSHLIAPGSTVPSAYENQPSVTKE